MNTATSKVPYGLLSDEQKNLYCREAKARGLYETYGKLGWNVTPKAENEKEFNPALVYRLRIMPKDWYMIMRDANSEVQLISGKRLEGEDHKSFIFVRMATTDEIESAWYPITLEEVQENYKWGETITVRATHAHTGVKMFTQLVGKQNDLWLNDEGVFVVNPEIKNEEM